jgi:uncharacterized caspase-like protein
MPRGLSVQSETLWCLLIGVSQYQDDRLRPLPYAVVDCQGLASVLASVAQPFAKTELIVHPAVGERGSDRAAISASLDRVVQTASPQDTIFFYFAGHGMVEPASQQAVLCLQDTQTDRLLETGFALSDLLQALGTCPAAAQIVVLDACHSGSLTLRQSPLPTFVQQLQQVAVRQQRQHYQQKFYALLSCDHNEGSLEFPELGHGLFTYYLIKGLQGEAADKYGVIEIKALYKYIYHRVLQYIDQQNQQLQLIYQQQRSQGETQPPRRELPLQSPKLIVEAVGDWWLTTPSADPSPGEPSQPLRRALIVDGMANSQVTQELSRRLGAGFQITYWHPQARPLPPLHSMIQAYLTTPDVMSDKTTTLIYLRGQIEEIEAGEVRLAITPEISISRSWLRQQLHQSRLSQQIVILDCPGTASLQSWVEELQLNGDRSQCLLLGAAAREHPDEFALALLQALQRAELAKGLSIAGWITATRRTLAGSPVWHNFWLGGVQQMIEVLPAVSDPIVEHVDLGICPYRGLRAFDEADAPYFCGREALTQQLVNAMHQQSFVAIVGASGSGKSSVMQAGLIAQLRQGNQIPGSDQWWLTSFRPGAHPLRALAQVMADPPVVQSATSPSHRVVLEYEGLLHLGGAGFVHWIRRRPEPQVVLAIDQFEELFTLTAIAERDQLLAILWEALEYAADKFKLVITLRSDFLTACLDIAPLAEKLQSSSILVPPYLATADYREVIVNPAQLVDLHVEPGLVELLLQDLQHAAGDLPLLQFVLEQLWEHRQQATGTLTIAAYQETIGGLQGALERTAEAVYYGLSDVEKAVAQWLFLTLTHLGEDAPDTKRKVYQSDLLQSNYPAELVQATLQKFTAAKLIVLDQADISWAAQPRSGNAPPAATLTNLNPEVTIEVAHEILIRHWSTLRWWLAENRDRLHLRQRLERQAQEWQKSRQHPDLLLRGVQLLEAEQFYQHYRADLRPVERNYIVASQRRRRDRRLHLGGLVTLTSGIILSFGGIAWQQQQQSQLAQLVRYASFNTITPEIARSVVNSLPLLLHNARTQHQAGKLEQALDDYRQIFAMTAQLQQTLAQTPLPFQAIVPQRQRIQSAHHTAEQGIVALIAEFRLPQLEQDLQQKKFGQQVASDRSKFEHQYTGALKTTYAILLRQVGANADRNNDSDLSEGEALYLPCATLQQIDTLWRKYTQNRCSWVDHKNLDDQPACRELGRQTLTAKLFWAPTRYLVEERLRQCQFIR